MEGEGRGVNVMVKFLLLLEIDLQFATRPHGGDRIQVRPEAE